MTHPAFAFLSALLFLSFVWSIDCLAIWAHFFITDGWIWFSVTCSFFVWIDLNQIRRFRVPARHLAYIISRNHIWREITWCESPYRRPLNSKNKMRLKDTVLSLIFPELIFCFRCYHSHCIMVSLSAKVTPWKGSYIEWYNAGYHNKWYFLKFGWMKICTRRGRIYRNHCHHLHSVISQDNIPSQWRVNKLRDFQSQGQNMYFYLEIRERLQGFFMLYQKT